jgi:hypothetical protein
MASRKKILSTTLAALGFFAFGPCLAQDVNTLQNNLNTDQAQADKDKAALDAARKQDADYEAKVQQQLDNAAAARPGVQARLTDLEKRFSARQLRKLLATPGNELYVLNTWLKQEVQARALADRYIGMYRNRIQQLEGTQAYDQQAIGVDETLLERAQAQESTSDAEAADQKRKDADAKYWANKNSPPADTGSINPAFILGAPLGTVGYIPWKPEDSSVLNPLYRPDYPSTGAGQGFGNNTIMLTGDQ